MPFAAKSDEGWGEKDRACRTKTRLLSYPEPFRASVEGLLGAQRFDRVDPSSARGRDGGGDCGGCQDHRC